MKNQSVVLLCLFVLAGCGESRKEKLTKSRAAAKVRAAAEAKAAVEARKQLASVIVEKFIRGMIKKPTGELTKADLEKVKNLFIMQQGLTEIPENLGKLTQLTWLGLIGNHLTDVEGLENLAQLKELYLDGNQLTDVKGLEKLTQLTELGLRDNQLTELPKGLEKLTQLSYLSLEENQLTDVKGLKNLKQLESLDLDGNQLTDVKGLEKLTQLKELDLKDNPDLTKAQIAELQKVLPKCNISHNAKLTAKESVEAIEAAIRKAAKKPTGELTKGDLEKVKELGYWFWQGQLTHVKGFGKLTQLTELYLSGSQITDVTDLEKLTQLTTLVLSVNHLIELPRGLENLTKLEVLDLSDNQLTDVKGLEKCTQLRQLGLVGNKLTDVKGLEKLTQLKELDLKDNPDLTKAQIDQLQKALPKCKIEHNAKK